METPDLNRHLDLKGEREGFLGDKTSPVTLDLRHQLLPQPPLASIPLILSSSHRARTHSSMAFFLWEGCISLLKAYLSPTTVLGKPVTLAVPWAPRDLY